MGLDLAVQPVLYHALAEAMENIRAVAAVVYLTDGADRQRLTAAMIVGTPPAVFILLQSIDVQSPNASATAWRTGRIAVIGEPVVGESIAASPDCASLPYPYSVAASPFRYTSPTGVNRGGSLSVIRVPGQDGFLNEIDYECLQRIAARLASRFAYLEKQGVAVRPGARVAMVPRFKVPSTQHTAWGVHGIDDAELRAGSSAITMMEIVHHCYPQLGQTRTLEEVTQVAQSQIMRPLGSQAMILSMVGDERMWVVGHAGISSVAARRLHGAAAECGTPPADVLTTTIPQFWSQLADLHAAYPNLRDPTPYDGCASWAIMPLHASGRVVGTVSLGWRSPHDVDSDEQGLLAMLARLLGSALDRACLNEAEHTLAQTLQTRLLPGVLPHLSELSTAARYLPATVGANLGGASVGGDWYDVIATPDGRIWLIVGDVEGHAIEAAAVMGQLRSAVRAYAAEGHGPAAVLTRASSFLAEESTLLATCCLIRLDPADGTLEAALAGHPEPLIRRPDGKITLLDAARGLPLGVELNSAYETSQHVIEPRTVIVLYTDGLCVPHNQDVQAEAQRLLLQADSQGASVGCNLEALADDLMAEAEHTSRPDDAAVLVARYDATRGTPHRRTTQMHIERHDLRGVAEARAFIHKALTEWHCESVIEDVELSTSEIVTNALIHADSSVNVRLREFPDHIRVEVNDTTVAPPVPSSLALADEDTNEYAEGGRGLLIVEHIARSWGSSPSGRGKSVWFELSRV
ncbi:SpoIIE family protein phosphatase [Streptomyces spiralis]|uniref:SpoIIE family protein phosphatase n=1 Tax=Streptomyces spiralis TaxID=66376 RepID=UPI0036765501